jgi:hypothetical protein
MKNKIRLLLIIVIINHNLAISQLTYRDTVLIPHVNFELALSNPESIKKIVLRADYFTYEQLKEMNKFFNVHTITINSLIDSIPCELTSLPNIENIELYSCINLNYQNLLSRFNNDKIKSVIITNDKKLKRIPLIIFSFLNLQTLDLSNNNIKEIPNEISSLKSLKVFNLWDNDLRNIKDCFCKLDSLTILILRDNPQLFKKDVDEKLKKIRRLKELKELSLTYTGLKKFPSILENLENLESLDLNCNKIPYIPNNIKGFPKLSYLSLHVTENIEIPDNIEHVRLIYIDYIKKCKRYWGIIIDKF